MPIPGGLVTVPGSIGAVPGARWAACVAKSAAAGAPPVRACAPISRPTASAPKTSPTTKKTTLIFTGSPLAGFGEPVLVRRLTRGGNPVGHRSAGETRPGQPGQHTPGGQGPRDTRVVAVVCVVRHGELGLQIEAAVGRQVAI